MHLNEHDAINYGGDYSHCDFVKVSNGRSNGRSSHQPLQDGTVTIAGTDEKGVMFRRIVQIVQGEIMDNRLMIGGRVQHRIAYGKFESGLTPKGREVIRFHAGSGAGKHGKSRRRAKLFEREVWCHSWYKQGRLLRQKCIYDLGGLLAYDWRSGGKVCELYHPDGTLRYRLTGEVASTRQWLGDSVFDRGMADWFKQSAPFAVEQDGRVIYAGQHTNGQRTGKWILEGKEHYYEHGVAIPKALFETPPEKLDPVQLLALPNAQLRMALLAKAKFDGERLAQCGRVIHQQGAMRLFDVKGLETRILRVQCTSTKSYYYIHVPRDSNRCEAARQWTFHVGAGVRQPIQFAQET